MVGMMKTVTVFLASMVLASGCALTKENLDATYASHNEKVTMMSVDECAQLEAKIAKSEATLERFPDDVNTSALKDAHVEMYDSSCRGERDTTAWEEYVAFTRADPSAVPSVSVTCSTYTFGTVTRTTCY